MRVNVLKALETQPGWEARAEAMGLDGDVLRWSDTDLLAVMDVWAHSASIHTEQTYRASRSRAASASLRCCRRSSNMPPASCG